jgi:transcriptional regulator with XRE-family HTH domain
MRILPMKCNISSKLQTYYTMVGNLVKEARKKQNMSVGMLAILAGVTPKHIELLENGRPGYQNGYFLERVARALEVDVESIYPTVEGGVL